MTYAFYVLQGGFAVDVKNIPTPGYPLSLSPESIEYLAMRGYFIPMAPKAIRDKSHTDMLAKMLGCFQVTWFAIQIIGRAAYKLPVSLLEIHLSVNIAFILAAYIFWIQV
jgi:hypothetical protein